MLCKVLVNPRWAKGYREEAEDEGVCPSVGPRCLWEIVSVSGPTDPGRDLGEDQVLFSLDRIYIDSFPRRRPRRRIEQPKWRNWISWHCIVCLPFSA